MMGCGCMEGGMQRGEIYFHPDMFYRSLRYQASYAELEMCYNMHLHSVTENIYHHMLMLVGCVMAILRSPLSLRVEAGER